MVTREQALRAGAEIGDLIRLVLDEVSNTEQLTEFVSEGFQAVQTVAGVGIPATDKEKVASNIAEGILNRLNLTVLRLAA